MTCYIDRLDEYIEEMHSLKYFIRLLVRTIPSKVEVALDYSLFTLFILFINI